MLKFLRKYQLIVLAIGGSLLMVVFLLEPVLNQITPDERKRPVATVGTDGKKFTRGDQVQANIELDLLTRFMPAIPFLLGIDPENRTAHWMLLKHEAERLGVMGVQQDGADWIPELAFGLVQEEIRRAQQMGQNITSDEVNQLLDMSIRGLRERKNSLLLQSYGLTDAGFNEIMSKARGVSRLRRLYDTAPRLSEPSAVRAIEQMATRVLTDQVVLGPELLTPDLAMPSDEQLAGHLALYQDNRPGDTSGNEFGFGYLLPARVKLEWLVLEPRRIAEVVRPDPVAVRRRWQAQNPDGGSFNEDRARIENEILQERVSQIVNDADEIIRGEILGSIRGVEREGIYRSLPEGWARPDLEHIAQDVVEAIAERHGARIPLPSVIRRTDRWLTPQELQQVPGVGRAVFRVGNRTVPVSYLPSLVRGIGQDTTVAVQIGLPIIDPVAQGADNTRYYITVIDARAESSPDGVDEIRDQLVRDYNSMRAFRMHTDRLAEYHSVAIAGGLDAVAAMFAPESGQSPVLVRENIFVMQDGLVPATWMSRPDPRADDEAFRSAVMAAAADLDPMTEPDSLAADLAVVAVPLPGSRSVALAKVRAKVPPTLEDYRRFEAGLVARETFEMVQEAQTEGHPLQFDRLAERLRFVELGVRGEEDKPAPVEGDPARAD